MRVLPSGDRALLGEYATLEETMGAYRALLASAPDGVVELVPAARTVLVRLDPRMLPLAAADRWLRETEPLPPEDADGPAVELAVRYDGPDLAEAATALGMSSSAELVARHTGTVWRSAFVGFAPGFAYLVAEGGAGALAEPWSTPRRSTSRPRVPAGSVGLAGEFSGVYPRESPGGWQLIGTTEAVLWDERRDPPALLAPGTRVTFRAVPSLGAADTPAPPEPHRPHE